MSINNEFTGPIFLVGMPRSGTKLLREVLNNHSQIGITGFESHFIPYYHKNIGKFGDLKQLPNFERFYEEFSRSVFFKRLTENDHFIDAKSWYEQVDDWSYPGVVEAFYAAYAKHKNKTIWGDKTPFYLVILPLLKTLFPKAKFVHIIRDVRDYSMSLKKSWYKNIYRSAQRWHDSVAKCRNDGKKLGDENYFEVRYEHLVDSPADTAASICDFLKIPYEPDMVQLKRVTERGGDAKDMVGILPNNYGKWRKSMPKKTIEKVERICGPLLADLDYSVSYSGAAQRLSKFEMNYYKWLDGVNLLRFHLKVNHFKPGLSNFFNSLKYNEFRDTDENQYGSVA